jgi:hypothetical protein
VRAQHDETMSERSALEKHLENTKVKIKNLNTSYVSQPRGLHIAVAYQSKGLSPWKIPSARSDWTMKHPKHGSMSLVQPYLI